MYLLLLIMSSCYYCAKRVRAVNLLELWNCNFYWRRCYQNCTYETSSLRYNDFHSSRILKGEWVNSTKTALVFSLLECVFDNSESLCLSSVYMEDSLRRGIVNTKFFGCLQYRKWRWGITKIVCKVVLTRLIRLFSKNILWSSISRLSFEILLYRWYSPSSLKFPLSVLSLKINCYYSASLFFLFTSSSSVDVFIPYWSQPLITDYLILSSQILLYISEQYSLSILTYFD